MGNSLPQRRVPRLCVSVELNETLQRLRHEAGMQNTRFNIVYPSTSRSLEDEYELG